MSTPLDYIVWIVTAHCNLSCLHCYAKIYLQNRELSKSEKLRLVEEFAEVNVRHIAISGGEPLLLGDELVDIVRRIVDIGLSTSIVTNGTILNEELIRKLIKHETYVYVSVDGDKISHEAIRGKDTWSKTMTFLELLCKYTHDFGTVMAISSLNYEHVDKYVDIVLKFNPESINVIPVMPCGNAAKSGVYARQEHLAVALRKLDEKCREYGILVYVWCLPCLRQYVYSNNLVPGYCKLRRVIDIAPDGSLLLCDTTGIVVERWSPELKLRDVIDRYWNSQLVKSVIENIPEECRECSLVEYCRGGCFARAYLMFRDLYKPDPLCPRVGRLVH